MKQLQYIGSQMVFEKATNLGGGYLEDGRNQDGRIRGDRITRVF